MTGKEITRPGIYRLYLNDGDSMIAAVGVAAKTDGMWYAPTRWRDLSVPGLDWSGIKSAEWLDIPAPATKPHDSDQLRKELAEAIERMSKTPGRIVELHDAKPVHWLIFDKVGGDKVYTQEGTVGTFFPEAVIAPPGSGVVVRGTRVILTDGVSFFATNPPHLVAGMLGFPPPDQMPKGESGG